MLIYFILLIFSIKSCDYFFEDFFEEKDGEQVFDVVLFKKFNNVTLFKVIYKEQCGEWKLREYQNKDKLSFSELESEVWCLMQALYENIFEVYILGEDLLFLEHIENETYREICDDCPCNKECQFEYPDFDIFDTMFKSGVPCTPCDCFNCEKGDSICVQEHIEELISFKKEDSVEP
jgi:hypothetical protein